MHNMNKVIYKPDPQSTDEFTIIVDQDEYSKWKNGDTSIPLSQVVDCKTFTVFFSGQGAQGILGQASKQQLDTSFGTHDETEVVEHILKHGREQRVSLNTNAADAQFNPTRGRFYDSAGGGRT
ncbi:DUF1960-domain-containing protein [Coprinopsis marcescibilis]|uniref:DUF1960-domain-containing protein n=1 Tax=Coprinopsis marcescibilis TaxID=230819 RepID=A0A5C3KWQ5_COPMA|nr:DUF1960-domain-containing protein [Coprinopsis marcescibilis]